MSNVFLLFLLFSNVRIFIPNRFYSRIIYLKSCCLHLHVFPGLGSPSPSSGVGAVWGVIGTYSILGVVYITCTMHVCDNRDNHVSEQLIFSETFISKIYHLTKRILVKYVNYSVTITVLIEASLDEIMPHVDRLTHQMLSTGMTTTAYTYTSAFGFFRNSCRHTKEKQR